MKVIAATTLAQLALAITVDKSTVGDLTVRELPTRDEATAPDHFQPDAAHQECVEHCIKSCEDDDHCHEGCQIECESGRDGPHHDEKERDPRHMGGDYDEGEVPEGGHGGHGGPQEFIMKLDHDKGEQDRNMGRDHDEGEHHEGLDGPDHEHGPGGEGGHDEGEHHEGLDGPYHDEDEHGPVDEGVHDDYPCATQCPDDLFTDKRLDCVDELAAARANSEAELTNDEEDALFQEESECFPPAVREAVKKCQMCHKEMHDTMFQDPHFEEHAQGEGQGSGLEDPRSMGGDDHDHEEGHHSNMGPGHEGEDPEGYGDDHDHEEGHHSNMGPGHEGEDPERHGDDHDLAEGHHSNMGPGHEGEVPERHGDDHDLAEGGPSNMGPGHEGEDPEGYGDDHDHAEGDEGAAPTESGDAFIQQSPFTTVTNKVNVNGNDVQDLEGALIKGKKTIVVCGNSVKFVSELLHTHPDYKTFTVGNCDTTKGADECVEHVCSEAEELHQTFKVIAC